MRLFIAPRAGFWCRSVSGWDSLRSALAVGAEPAERLPDPVPQLLPAREGRRAPLHVRIGIEAGIQACHDNAVSPAEVTTVFASAQGDIQITDYMCRTLAGPAPILSPTRFHNSVHNATSGYWSIGAVNHAPGSAIAAQEHTFPMALLEAATLAITGGGPVLLVAHDVAAPAPLDSVCRARQPFAVGLLLSELQVTSQWRPMEACVLPVTAPWPEPTNPWLRLLASENDSARGLPLLEALAAATDRVLTLPLAAGASLELHVGA